MGTYFSTLKEVMVYSTQLFSQADDIEIVATSLVVDDKEQMCMNCALPNCRSQSKKVGDRKLQTAEGSADVERLRKTPHTNLSSNLITWSRLKHLWNRDSPP